MPLIYAFSTTFALALATPSSSRVLAGRGDYLPPFPSVVDSTPSVSMSIRGEQQSSASPRGEGGTMNDEGNSPSSTASSTLHLEPHPSPPNHSITVRSVIPSNDLTSLLTATITPMVTNSSNPTSTQDAESSNPTSIQDEDNDDLPYCDD